MEKSLGLDETEVIWGAAAIGKIIGLNPRQTFHLLETGQLRGARKVGGRWCITRRALLENFQPSATSERLRDLIQHLTQEERRAFFGEVA